MRSASAWSGTEITEVWDSQISRRIRSFTENNKVTRDETSHFFRRMSLPVGGTEIRCEEETGSQNARTNLFKHIFLKQKKNKKQPHKT